MLDNGVPGESRHPFDQLELALQQWSREGLKGYMTNFIKKAEKEVSINPYIYHRLMLTARRRLAMVEHLKELPSSVQPDCTWFISQRYPGKEGTEETCNKGHSGLK